MSRVTFENYGRRAKTSLNDTEVAGRYSVQEDAERLIVPDVLRKLEIEGEHSLLEIGCGTGNLLIPLSFLVKSAIGIDHPDVVERFRARTQAQNIFFVEGNFLDLETQQRFDRILIYSVLHCLSDYKEVEIFVEKAMSLLEPGGRMLIGDIPNSDAKARFLATNAGRAFEESWRNEKDDKEHSDPEIDALEDDPQVFVFDDETVLRLLGFIRRCGYESFLLPQHATLPFGNTRQDIIVENHH